MEYKFKQDDLVVIADAYGFGKEVQANIKGVASTGNPTIGVSYIVKPKGNVVDKDVYPYSHFVVFECHLTKID